MANLIAATKALLRANTTLYGVTGYAKYILDRDDVGREGLKTVDIKPANQPIVSPSIYLNWQNEIPFGDGPSSPDGSILATRGFVELYFYDHSTYTTIRLMRRLVWDLLHQKRVAVDAPDWLYAFIWQGDVLDMDDPELAGALMERSRFEFHYLRR